jgi:hypothetical protein
MLTPQRRGLAIDIADRLIDLYICRAEACGQEDWHRVRRLEAEIKNEAACRQAILDMADSPSRRS